MWEPRSATLHTSPTSFCGNFYELYLSKKLDRFKYVSFAHDNQLKYGRIRVIRHSANGVTAAVFVFEEWKTYIIPVDTIAQIIPAVRNKEDLKKTDLKVGSKVYLGSYISADGPFCRRNVAEYPLRWTVKRKTDHSLTFICDWVVECISLTDYDFYTKSLLQEAFTTEERTLIGTTYKDGKLISGMTLPDQEDVSDASGKPEQVDSPYLDEILYNFDKMNRQKVNLEIEANFHYWITSDDPEINFVASWGWDHADEDADAIGFRPKLVIRL